MRFWKLAPVSLLVVLVFALTANLDYVTAFSPEISKVAYNLRQRNMAYDEQLDVVVELTGNVSIRHVLEPLGFSFRLQMYDLVEGSVKESALRSIATIPQVKFVRRPLKPTVFAITSEGVSVIGANKVQAEGQTGQSIKIGILDVGFDPSNPEIASNVVEYRSFRSDRRISGDNDEERNHGTGVSEIVVDVAPGSRLYLYNFVTEVQFLSALDFALSRGAQVISTSVGWANVGPLDGTSRISQAIDRARSVGVLVTVAAGNEARRHWEGYFTDTNGDLWHEWIPGDPRNTVVAKQGDSIEVFLSWDDWPNSSQDYDLYLTDDAGNIVARSETRQTGFAPPAEDIEYPVSVAGRYHIQIRKFRSTRNLLFELFTFTHDLKYFVTSSSVVIPADARGAIAVGATNVFTDIIEPYSSRGPTVDGRVKPDFVAPDGVSTSVFRPFLGSSASTPHVAGAIALLVGFKRNALPDQIVSALEVRAKHLGDPGKDTTYGAGRIDVYGAYLLLKGGFMGRQVIVHGHPEEITYPAEPSSELPIRVTATYVRNGSTFIGTFTTLFQITVDSGSVLNLTSVTLPLGFRWLRWDVIGRLSSHSRTVIVTVNADLVAVGYATRRIPDFSITVNPPAQSISLAGSASFVASVRSINGFNMPVILAALNLPTGVTATLSVNPVVPPADGVANSTLTIRGGPSARVGRYNLTLTGLSENLQHAVFLALTLGQIFKLTVSTNPRVSNVQFRIDGTLYQTPADGRFSVDVALGRHSVELVTTAIRSGNSSLTFISWSGAASSASSAVTVDVSGDAFLVANYIAIIPGFPLESIMLGAVAATAYLVASRRKRIAGKIRKK